MSEETPSIITRSYEALSRRDLDAWLDTTTPDLELHEVDEVPDAQVYRGHREAREWAEAMLQLTEEWRWTPEEVLLNDGETVVVRTSIAGHSQGGVPIDLEVFHVFQTAGDRVASVRGFLDRSSALEAAGLSE